jgi:hypothetical protein
VAGARPFELLTRAGFAVRGILYGLIGWLALKSGRTEDGEGILATLDTSSGQFLLAAMALGFFAYAAWRLAEAWVDASGHGGDAKGLAVRAGGAVSGLIHLGFGIAAMLRVLDSGGGGGGGDSARQGAQTALNLPGGWLMLVAAAGLLAAVGLFQIGRAWTASFMRNLAPSGAARDWICRLGRAGFLARGIVFLVMALFLFRAGNEERSSEAGGVGEALGSLPASLQMAVAAGFLLFGLFSLAEARYRRIDGRIADQLART